MATISQLIKKYSGTVGFSLTLNLLLMSSSYAAGGGENGAILAQIKCDTDAILSQINKLPAYISSITEMATDWIATQDQSNTIANNQYAIAQLTSSYNSAAGDQINDTKDITKQIILGAGNSSSSNSQLLSVDNAISYTTLLGNPLVAIQNQNQSQNNNTSPLDAYARAYIANASDANTLLTRMVLTPTASASAKKYIYFYNTISSIKSYDAYILNGLYHQRERDKYRYKLVSMASNSTWFTQVASEPLGLVLRQILMYQSQLYVQMDRLLKVQQEQLAASAMSNSLITLSLEQVYGTTLQSQANT